MHTGSKVGYLLSEFFKNRYRTTNLWDRRLHESQYSTLRVNPRKSRGGNSPEKKRESATKNEIFISKLNAVRKNNIFESLRMALVRRESGGRALGARAAKVQRRRAGTFAIRSLPSAIHDGRGTRILPSFRKVRQGYGMKIRKLHDASTGNRDL